MPDLGQPHLRGRVEEAAADELALEVDAPGVGLAIGLSFLIPFAITAASPKLHFEHSPPTQVGK